MSFIMTRIGASIALACLAFTTPALAHDYKVGAIEIGHPWARETPASATVGAGYFTAKNGGSAADRLIRVESPAAGKVEMHETTNEGGVARMRAVSAIDIPAGGEINFEPGGFHLMLIGLTQPLTPGMRVPATLVFEKAGAVDIELAVENMAYGKKVDDPAGGHRH